MFLSRLPRPVRVGLYALATGVVLYMCLAPTPDVPGASLLWDKAEHAITWAILTGSGLLLSPRRPRAIVLYSLGLGAGIEVLQAAMDFGRQGDWRDFAADSIGAGLALLAWMLLRRWLGWNRKP
jgi:VanZ family protein